MPSTHAPIKKYNYERSLFRWVMSRHPEPFERHGITTRTLERAPLAREAFYTSDWPGARALVQSNDESKYERTAFFDAIIERGLRTGTRFSIDHVTSEERNKLGITMDRASGKYYLQAYGSPKARRGSSRRGSQTSSDGEAPDLPHVVIKEVEDMLTSEIEAAGENAEVVLVKKYTEPSNTRGSKLLHFCVSIRRRPPASGGGMEPGKERGEGAGAGPPLTQAADAGAGKTTPSLSGTGGLAPRRPSNNAPSSAGDNAARNGREGGSPRQSNGRDSTSLPAVPSKPRAKLQSNGTGDNEEFPAQSSPHKKRKSVTATVFGNTQRPGSSAEQGAPGLSTPAEAVMRFGRTQDGSGNSEDPDVKPTPRLTSSAPHQTMFSATSSSSSHFGTLSSRPQDMPSSGFSSWSSNFSQRGGLRMNPGGQMQSQQGTSGSTPGSVLVGSPMQSWHVHPSQSTRNEEFGQVTGRSGVGRTAESGTSDSGSTTTSTLGCGSLTSTSQSHHMSSMTSFGHRPAGSSTTLGRISPGTMVAPDQHASGVSGLNGYSTHMRSSHLTGMSNLHGGTPTSWGANNRITGVLNGGGNREPVDEEDMDFLASFF